MKEALRAARFARVAAMKSNTIMAAAWIYMPAGKGKLMMPTRLQGTLSASLLQWLRSCEDDAVKYVEVRIIDGANVEETACAMQNGGLEICEKTLSAVRGRIKAKDLVKFMYMRDISVITEIRPSEKENR